MSDYISREAASADECKHKMKTSFAKIIVGGTPEKPYYHIWYFDPADKEFHIGFGSYRLDYVFRWLAEEFEVKEPCADVEPVRRGWWEHKKNGYSVAWCSKRKGLFDITWHGKTAKECFAQFVEAYRYCPRCGAKMDLEDNNGT